MRYGVWCVALLLMGALSSCRQTGAENGTKTQEEPTLVVGSYNIWCGIEENAPFPWSQRRERIKELIRFHEYDLLGMQEVRPEQLAFFRTMEEYDLLGTGREGPGQGEHMTILYRKDRFQLLDSATFWLSETPDTVSLGWDAACNRICTWAKFRDRNSGREFFFFNTHLDHMGPTAQLEGARLLMRKIAEIAGKDSLPVLCTGDFNSRPESQPIAVMTQALQSAKSVSQTPPYGVGATFRGLEVGPAFDTLNVGEIDYLFVNKGVQVLKFGVLSDSDGHFYPSDHLPLWARVRLQ